MDMHRRGFLRGLAGAAAVALTPAAALFQPAATLKAKLRAYSFDDLVTEALRENAGTLASNLAANNALYARLKAQNNKPS